MADTIIIARSGLAVRTRTIRNPLRRLARFLVMRAALRGQLSARVALLALNAIGGRSA